VTDEAGPDAPTRHNYFDASVAATYDDDSGYRFDPAVVAPTVDFLADLARGGRALELGIGTGRIALPLARAGMEVHGIELSADMVAVLREKPGGNDIGITMGDFATAAVDGTFRLAYLIYNTIENLTSQDDQVACFCNVSRHLEPGGCFVIEVEVPQLRRLPPGETARPFHVGPDRLGFDELDPATQAGVSHHFWVEGDRSATFSMPFRWVWPSELDLMARIAGMRLRERWGDWNRTAFTSESMFHVSVWEKV
jgi:SAM-dependent methyltransferase